MSEQPSRNAAPSESAPPARRRRRWGRIALLCVVLLLAGGEIALRILCDFDSRFNIFLAAHSQFDPYLKFRLTPNYTSGDIHMHA